MYLISLIRHLYPCFDSVVSSKLIRRIYKHSCMTSNNQIARVKTKVNLSKTELTKSDFSCDKAWVILSSGQESFSISSNRIRFH